MDNNLRKWTESFIKHAAAKSAADDYAAVKDVLSSGSMLTNPLVGGGVGAALGGGVGAAINQFLGDPSTRKKLLLKRILTGAILGAGLGSMPGGIALSSAMPSSITPAEEDDSPVVTPPASNTIGPPVSPATSVSDTRNTAVPKTENDLTAKQKYILKLMREHDYKGPGYVKPAYVKKGQRTNVVSQKLERDINNAAKMTDTGRDAAEIPAIAGTSTGILATLARLGGASKKLPLIGQVIGGLAGGADLAKTTRTFHPNSQWLTGEMPYDMLKSTLQHIKLRSLDPPRSTHAGYNFLQGLGQGANPLEFPAKAVNVVAGGEKGERDWSGAAGSALGGYATWWPWLNPIAKGVGRIAAPALRPLAPHAVKALPYVAPAISAADAVAALGVTGMFGQDAKSKADALVDFKLRTVYNPTWISQHPFQTALSLPLTAITPSTGIAAAKKVFGGEGANRAQFSEAMKGDIASTQRIGQWLRSLPVEKRIEAIRSKPQLKSIFNQHLSGLQPRTNIPWWAYLPFGAQAWDPNKLVKAPGR